MLPHNMHYSSHLTQKLETLKARRQPVQLGLVQADSPLWLAPMSAICDAPFRQLMEELGAGATVSELISCHGINYKNDQTMRMLKLNPEEKNVGIQLFGEDANSMAEAAKVAQESKPKWIDINMGCPVRKVVTKGSGSALLKDTSKLGTFFSTIKKSIELPLTIKIRTGWDQNSINAPEVIRIAKEEGVEFVAIHGRTRTQQYTGNADWNLLEILAKESPLPIIGNGDLHTTSLVRKRMATTSCHSLMLGRGPLRNPFIFLEPYLNEKDDFHFVPSDYLEVINRYHHLLENYVERERTLIVQLRKLIVWMAAGFANVSHFRGRLFETQDKTEILKLSHDYFHSLMESGKLQKNIDLESPFMAGGHG